MRPIVSRSCNVHTTVTMVEAIFNYVGVCSNEADGGGCYTGSEPVHAELVLEAGRHNGHNGLTTVHAELVPEAGGARKNERKKERKNHRSSDGGEARPDRRSLTLLARSRVTTIVLVLA